jgi:hypothetical protein
LPTRRLRRAAWRGVAERVQLGLPAEVHPAAVPAPSCPRQGEGRSGKAGLAKKAGLALAKEVTVSTEDCSTSCQHRAELTKPSHGLTYPATYQYDASVADHRDVVYCSDRWMPQKIANASSERSCSGSWERLVG